MIGDWLDIGSTDQIAAGTARTLPVQGGDEIAVFRTLAGEVYALVNKCPHRGGPLSQGIIHGTQVTCPLHNWNISLRTGEAQGEDVGCVPTIPVRVDAGRIYLRRDAVIVRHVITQHGDAPLGSDPGVDEHVKHERATHGRIAGQQAA